MATVATGCTVDVHYTGKLDDGTVFDSSLEREPINFVVGEGQVIAGFEQAVLGMQVGESKNISLTPAEAYGDYDDDLVYTLDKSEIPGEVELGSMLQSNMDGSMTYFTVVDITEVDVTLDGNHPLAGHNLNFDITLVNVK